MAQGGTCATEGTSDTEGYDTYGWHRGTGSTGGYEWHMEERKHS